MSEYAFNPLTGNLDRVGDGGGGGGNITINTDNGTANGDLFSLEGQEAGIVPVMEVTNDGNDIVIANNTWWTQYVVDPSTVDGLKGTFQTIQAAINQAVADGASVLSLKMIYIRAGTYIENLTIPPGIFLKGESLQGNPNQLPLFTQITGQHVVAGTNLFRAEGIFFITLDATADLFTTNPINIFLMKNCEFSLGNSSGVFFDLNYSNQQFFNCTFFASTGQTCLTLSNNASVLFDNCTFPSSGNIEMNGFIRFWNCNQVGEIICDNGQIIAKDSMFYGDVNCISGTGAGCQYTNCQFNSSGPASVHTGQATFTNCSSAVGGNSGLYAPGDPIAQGTPTNTGNINITQRVDSNTTASIGINIYEVDCSAGAITVILPSTFPADICWTFKDVTGDAATNNITIQVQSATGTIDTAASYVINQDFGAVSVKGSTDGVNYITYANYGLGGGGTGTGFATVNVQVLTASGTYTPSPGMLYCVVESVGGGAAAGGSAATASSQSAPAGGGGGGEYALGLFDAATIGASQAVTIGAGGTAVSGNNPGGNGGTTSFGALLTALGGIGGSGAASLAGAVSNAGGNGGSGGTGGNVRFPGQYGTEGYFSGSDQMGHGGAGGGTRYSGGVKENDTVNSAGSNGIGYGCGGSGSYNLGVTTARAGGNGSPGLVYITEYIAGGGGPVGGMTWINSISGPVSMVAGNGYFSNDPANNLTFNLPATALAGTILEITNLQAGQNFTIAQASGQSIQFGSVSTTVGVGGSVSSTSIGDSLRMVCVSANTKWQVLSSMGNLSYV